MEKTAKSDRDRRGSLKLPHDLKRELKVAAAQHGMTEYGLIRETWNFWKKQKGKDWGPPEDMETQFGRLTLQEVELVRSVLDFWRNPPDDPGEIGLAVLKGFIKRYRAAGS